jgi:hypothetical protein
MYLVSPTGTNQYGVGNILIGNLTGSIASHLSDAASAISSLSTTDSSSGNSTIKAWGSEESLISTALSNMAGLVPSSLSSISVAVSYVIDGSYKDTGVTYLVSAKSDPGLPARSSTGSGLSNGCIPQYVIGSRPGDHVEVVEICVWEVIESMGLALGVAAVALTSCAADLESVAQLQSFSSTSVRLPSIMR